MPVRSCGSRLSLAAPYLAPRSFPKAPVWWYRSWWFGNISADDAGRPPVPGTATFVRIVESWAPPQSSGKTTRSINVYSNAAAVTLLVNGAPASGSPAAMPAYGAVNFASVPYAPGNLTAVALDASGNVLGTHTRMSWGAPAAILLTLDAPNAASGTGQAVYLDGEDVALVRATVVDANGVVCADATSNITFAVTSGPGMVVGVGNGDPSSHDPNHATWRPAYHGLVRAIVKVTIDAAGSASDRALLAAVNVEAGVGAGTSTILQGSNANAPTQMVVQATAPGLASASVTIALSTDPSASALATAAASVGAAFIGE